MLLWEEYRSGQPEGYGYSRFCDLYRDWQAGVSPTMRQTHVAGERLFVDFAGRTAPITDPITGAVRQAQIFVAALGASNYTYAEARWSQGLADWIGCYVNALAFFGGVTRQIVCDNLKAGVTAANRYEPGINRTYQEMAAHYSTAIVPTRVRKPRDTDEVEQCLLRDRPACRACNACRNNSPTDWDSHSSICIGSRANLRRAGRGQASRSDRRTAARA